MRRWKRFSARVANLFRKQPAESEMDREVNAHLALLAEDFEHRGLAPQDAMLAARRAWGGVEQTKELHRDERSFPSIEQFLQDLRHAVRSLSKSRVFTSVALLSLIFGIGVNTAIFTLVNGILLKQLPVRDPQRIVQLVGYHPPFAASFFSYPAYREIRARSDIFQDVIASFATSRNLTVGTADPVRVNVQVVTGSYFAFFGARPALGRLLDEEDDRIVGAHPVCVIAYNTWQTYFGGSPDALGRNIQVDNGQLEVVGVLPPDFVGAELQRRDDLWMPSAMASTMADLIRDSAYGAWLRIMARLKPGISFAEASARLQAATPAIAAALPKNNNRNQVFEMRDASKGLDSWRTRLHDPLVILMGAVTLVMLVACANLANLLLARAGERRQEFAIKLSLGISRWRLLRQLLLETFLLAFVGGSVALLLSAPLTGMLLAIFNTGNPFSPLQVAPDRAVLLFTFCACALTALIAGIYPAWHASRTDAGAGLKGGGAAGFQRSLVRRGLILIQVALAVVLLFGASLFTHSLHNLKSVDLGYDVDHVLSVSIAQSGPRRAQKPIKAAPQLIELLNHVRQLPAVQSAALSNPGYLARMLTSADLTISDAPGGARKVENVNFIVDTPGYLSTLRMSLLKGRDFTDADRDGSQPVAIVNQQFAALAWPGLDPIGRHLDTRGKTVEVIGVTGNGKYFGVRDETRPIVALAFAQSSAAGATLEVRCRGAIAPVERDIRSLIRSTAPDYRVDSASAMNLLRDASIAQDRLLAFLSDLFGALGVLLALVGIYGLISYSVTGRTREIGIRMSIGAQQGDVVWLFLREIALLLGIGMLIGLPLALLLAKYLARMLYQVGTEDPVAIAATLLLLTAGALLASAIPTRKATNVNPVQALRYE
jgi:predicted permease